MGSMVPRLAPGPVPQTQTESAVEGYGWALRAAQSKAGDWLLQYEMQLSTVTFWLARLAFGTVTAPTRGLLASVAELGKQPYGMYLTLAAGVAVATIVAQREMVELP
jgi:hypothetical protein